MNEHICTKAKLLVTFWQVEEIKEAMECEMRTQLRRQAAAHSDHLRDVLKIQEQELKLEFDKVGELFSSSLCLDTWLSWIISKDVSNVAFAFCSIQMCIPVC